MTPYYFYKIQQKNSAKNRILNTFIIVLAIGIIVVYLIEANSISINSFEAEILKNRTQELKTDNQILEVEISKINSMSNLEFYKEKLVLVKTNQLDYLNIPIPAVAEK